MYLLLIHGLMLVMVVNLPLSAAWSVLVVLLILASCVYYCRQYQWLNGSSAIIKIERDNNDQWILYDRAGKQYSTQSLNSSFVISKVVILHFNSSSLWQNKSVLIVDDSVDQTLFRQLRVYCRNPKTFQQ